MLVDRLGRVDHVGENQSTDDDENASVEDEDDAPHGAERQEQSAADARSRRLDQSQREQSAGHLDEDDDDPQQDRRCGALPSESLDSASNGVEEDHAAERPVGTHRRGGTRARRPRTPARSASRLRPHRAGTY